MTCPSCSRELPGEVPFCPFCGFALTDAPPGPGREERKVVTVLFADLVGFTARAERLDQSLDGIVRQSLPAAASDGPLQERIDPRSLR